MKNCLTFIINFRVNTSLLTKEECDKLPLTSLLKIFLKNGEYLSLENNDGKLVMHVFANGENNRTSYKVPNRKIKPTEEIDSIVFFENFY